MEGEPEFQRITIMGEYGCFLWAVERESGEDRLVGIDFDVLGDALGTDVPQPLVEQFLQWHSEWDDAHMDVVDPSCECPGDEWFQEFHSDGRALAKELSDLIEQPVEYQACPCHRHYVGESGATRLVPGR